VALMGLWRQESGLLLRASLLGARWGGVLSLAEVCRFLPEFRQVVIVVRLRSIWGCSRGGLRPAGAVMLVRGTKGWRAFFAGQ
jgi:hypothetical protein